MGKLPAYDSWEVRLAAAEALSLGKPPSWKETLQQASDDDNEWVAAVIEEALD